MPKITTKPFPRVFEDKLAGFSSDERAFIGDYFTQAKEIEINENPIEGRHDIQHLCDIHKHLFEDASTHAGVIRGYSMNKGGTDFADAETMQYILDSEFDPHVAALEKNKNEPDKYIDAMVQLHSTIDELHPFREGNGRSARLFLAQIASEHNYDLNFSGLDKEQWVEASKKTIIDHTDINLKTEIFKKHLTPQHLERAEKAGTIHINEKIKDPKQALIAKEDLNKILKQQQKTNTLPPITDINKYLALKESGNASKKPEPKEITELKNNKEDLER